jgi:hypothetical protein
MVNASYVSWSQTISNKVYVAADEGELAKDTYKKKLPRSYKNNNSNGEGNKHYNNDDASFSTLAIANTTNNTNINNGIKKDMTSKEWASSPSKSTQLKRKPDSKYIPDNDMNLIDVDDDNFDDNASLGSLGSSYSIRSLGNQSILSRTTKNSKNTRGTKKSKYSNIGKHIYYDNNDDASVSTFSKYDMDDNASLTSKIKPRIGNYSDFGIDVGNSNNYSNRPQTTHDGFRSGSIKHDELSSLQTKKLP